MSWVCVLLSPPHSKSTTVAYKLLDCKTQLKRFRWTNPLLDETRLREKRLKQNRSDHAGGAEEERRSRCGGEERLCLVRFHVRPQERVDARLVSVSLSLEPVQYLAIQPDGHCRFRLREPYHRLLEVVLTLLWDIG